MDDEVFVYRLIPVSWCQAVDGEWEFQSGAFDNATPEHEDDSPDDMSVVVGDTLAALHRAPEALPAETPWADDEWGVAALQAAFLRHSEEQKLRRTPNDDERAHGDVRGKKGHKRRRRLKRHATWVVRPAAPPS